MKRLFTFDKYNSWYDWRSTLTGKSVSAPEPKTNYIELDGAHGTLDLTEALTGEVTYNDRTVTASFLCSEGSYEDRRALLRDIASALHGRKVQIVEPDDIDHYFLGRVTVKVDTLHPVYTEFTLTATCDPWRYAIEASDRSVTVDHSAVDVVLHNNGVKTLLPLLTVEGSVYVTANGVTTELTTGPYKISTLKLYQGANVVNVSGTGKVTFTYREAML